VAHKKEIDSMNKLNVRMEENYSRLLEENKNEILELEKELSELRDTNKDIEEKYVASKTICIGLGAAVIGALFLGTLMGAKTRRDSLKVSKNHVDEGTA